ncbi:hypothetical protein MVEG_12309 [Podila verticillata NRRL 6337]|uniref:Uncharacterized protein n=1 Tax=Podila verticillata NRRL 6337 TaxID=1069443 RepID=A0A086TIV4_9FUNG|nr:hypothetical protein MVEG_12309 [Podila verticillata NRRL 6337]
MFGSLVLSRHTTSSRGSATISYFGALMHSALYSAMIRRSKSLRHPCPKESLLQGLISYVRNMTAPAFQLRYVALSSIMNPVVFLALIYKIITPLASKRRSSGGRTSIHWPLWQQALDKPS